MDVMLRDPALAPDGRRKIEFAARRMPVLEAVRAEFERTRPLRGLRIAACLHVTAETANLCRALAAAIEERVARQKLAALGVRCDQLRDDQRDYLRSWRAGTGA
jgi:S-adenosylhomocysteine hydrolase